MQATGWINDICFREWMIDHLEIESTVLHKESEEAKVQLQREGANKLGKLVVLGQIF